MNTPTDTPLLSRRFLTTTLIAFVLRAAFLAAVGTDPKMYLTPDSAAYLDLAQNLKTLGHFTLSSAPPFESHTLRTPGYPAFLALFGGTGGAKVLAIIWVQALLGGLTAGLLFLTGQTLWSRRDAAAVAGFGMAFDYVIVLYSSFVMTEATFMFAQVVCMLMFARFMERPKGRMSSLLVAGAATGICVLIRPVALYYFVVPAFILCCAGWTGKISHAARAVVLFLAAAVLLPGLWMLRNRIETGAFTISSLQGLTRAAILEERFTGLGFYEATERLEAQFKQEHPGGFASPGEESSAKSLWATRFILSHPKDYAVVLVQETVRILAGNGMKSAAWMAFKDERHNPFTIEVHPKESNQEQAAALTKAHPSLGVSLVLYLALLGGVYVLALAGCAMGWKNDRLNVTWLVLTAAYFLAVSVGFGAGARYRLPMMPPIFLLAGLGLERWRKSPEKI